MEEVNNKKRPAGSGTTTGKRREQRQAMQWNTLQQANPPVTTAADMEAQANPPVTTAADMEAQVEALKKATESAQKQRAQLEKAEEQQKKAAKKPGKTGPRSAEEWAAASAAKPKLVSLAQVQRQQELLQREQELKAKLPSLKKEFAAKNSTGSSSSAGAEASLKKDSIQPASLKKEKQLVIIDWHNTLKLNDAIPKENLAALKKVLEVADVRIISWVNSEARRKSTLKQIRELIPHETLKKVKGYQTIWYKCGEGGKVHWADQGAHPP
eukprot:s1600_g8.t1